MVTKDKKITGFTLIELLVVVAIISLLVAVAIPQYRNFVIRCKKAEAPTILSAMHKGEIAYFATYDQFYPPNAPVGDSLVIGNIYDVLKTIGLEDIYDLSTHKTKLGWGWNTIYVSGPNSGSQNRSVGYWAGLWQDFDERPGGDLWEIRMPPTYVGGGRDGCPVGIPYNVRNEITGNWYSPTCI